MHCLRNPRAKHEAGTDAILAILAASPDAGLIEVITDAQGRESCKLTPEGLRAARQIAMSDEAGQDELLKGLLGHEE